MFNPTEGWLDILAPSHKDWDKIQNIILTNVKFIITYEQGCAEEGFNDNDTTL